MARFGKDLVRSLTQPSFTQGLFDVGEKIGGLPEASRKKKATEGMLKELSEAQASGNTSALADIYERLGTESGDPQYTLHAASLRNTNRLNTAQMEVVQSLEKLNDPTLSESERAVLEGEAKTKALALNDPQFYSTALSSISSARSVSRTNTKIAAVEAVSSGKTRDQYIEEYGEEDAFEYDIAKSQALNTKASIKASEDAVVDANFAETMQELSNRFEMIMARPTEFIDQQAAIDVQREMVDLAQKAGKPVGEYTEIFSTRFQQKVTDEIDAINQAEVFKEAEGFRWADSTVQAIIRSGGADPLATLANRMESVTDPKVQALYEKHISYIKEGVEDHFQAVDEISESFKTGQPSATAIDFLSDSANANYFEGLDAVENAFAEIKKFNKKVADGGTLNANDRTKQRANVKLINEAVAKARNARRKQELSEPVAELNAEKAISNYLSGLREFKAGTVARFFGGQSVYDAVERSANEDGELHKRILGALKREFMLQSNVPAQRQFEIIKEVVEEMRVETPGEEGFQARYEKGIEVREEIQMLTSEKLKLLNPKNPDETTSAYNQRIQDLSEDKEKMQEVAFAVEEDLIEMEQADIAERRRLIAIARSSGYR
jgi:ribosomal protein L20A (L18A)